MAKLLLVAACALIDRDGRVLMARRPEGKTHAGLWEFPGGKFAQGETPEAALVRALKEELAIDTEALGEFHLLMPLYVCRKWSGTPKPVEGQELKWVRRDALMEMETPPADRPLAAQLRDYL